MACTEAFGQAAPIGRARRVPLRNNRAAISPVNVRPIRKGIVTLALRVERISHDTLAIAQQVGRVSCAGLASHTDHALAKKYLSGKASGMLRFGAKSAPGKGRETGARFLDAMPLFIRPVNIGHAKSLATHPASKTHPRCRRPRSTGPGSAKARCRLSVGIEHIDDLLAHLEQAPAAA